MGNEEIYFILNKFNRKEELTDHVLDDFQWKLTHLNFKQMKQLEIGFERFALFICIFI
jgi:hypothetical protein